MQPPASTALDRPRSPRRGMILGLIVVAVIVWSALNPLDWLTWWMEVSWVLVGLPVVVWIARRHGVTQLLLVLLTIHAIILLVGGHYTYERVPLGLWAQEWWGLARNDYDRLGHFAQGFVPALVAREALRRTSPLRTGKWLAVISVSMALAFSGCFEMIEWAASVSLGASADAFLGSQGDVWDAQWDMFCALLGATVAIAMLSKSHERALCALPSSA
ncbi:MAG: DUF2238 domain-containing protein [Phycisphaerales bacterium]|nr:DUF2238 domain-containing protein [Phycisphaerales bacterium]